LIRPEAGGPGGVGRAKRRERGQRSAGEQRDAQSARRRLRRRNSGGYGRELNAAALVAPRMPPHIEPLRSIVAVNTVDLRSNQNDIQIRQLRMCRLRLRSQYWKALADPGHKPRAEMPGWLGEEVDSPAFPLNTGAKRRIRFYQKRLSSPIMQNQEAGIASPQLAAIFQSNRQYRRTSETGRRRPCVTQRQFWRGPRRRNVSAWRQRRQHALAP
jgi:hypothetical protein